MLDDLNARFGSMVDGLSECTSCEEAEDGDGKNTFFKQWTEMRKAFEKNVKPHLSKVERHQCSDERSVVREVKVEGLITGKVQWGGGVRRILRGEGRRDRLSLQTR